MNDLAFFLGIPNSRSIRSRAAGLQEQRKKPTKKTGPRGPLLSTVYGVFRGQRVRSVLTLFDWFLPRFQPRRHVRPLVWEDPEPHSIQGPLFRSSPTQIPVKCQLCLQFHCHFSIHRIRRHLRIATQLSAQWRPFRSSTLRSEDEATYLGQERLLVRRRSANPQTALSRVPYRLSVGATITAPYRPRCSALPSSRR